MTHPLRIGIAGLGTVGTSVVAIIEGQRALLRARTGSDIEITAVSARDKNKERSVELGAYRFESDPMALVSASDVDVVVELIGGAEGVAHELVKTALKNGKHVVTANKALIAAHGASLAAEAERKNCALFFEAAVAGGIPILKALREGLAANAISRVIGILNGTCNYILTHMWEGKRELADVLAEAQALGYAEADPSFDVGGMDAAHKLAILTALAYGAAPDLKHLHVEGIEGVSFRDMQFADQLGYTIRLLGITSRTEQGILQRVHPCLVAKGSSLASVRGVLGAVQVQGDSVGTVFMQGAGAGGAPTASSVVADVMDIARSNRSYAFGIAADKLAALKPAPMASLASAYYVRIGAVDKPGVLADITASFRDSGISVKSFIQHGQAAGEKVTIVIATHTTTEADMQRALATIAKQPSILEAPFSIRIEE
ncbi:MAG: homoserine dehydrogenase [Alphaproteobacteria bacterium]|nr:homoserine dehydrogenase [Alphaproteobacteria bacterium]